MSAITPLPTPPSRLDPVNFAARADAFLGALPGMVTEFNFAAAVASGAVMFQPQKIVATLAQTLFTLETPYTPGVNALAVYVNGLRMTPGDDYVESSTTTVTMTSGLALGDEVLFIVGRQLAFDTVNAANVGINDVGDYYAGSSVDAVLQELGARSKAHLYVDQFTGASDSAILKAALEAAMTQKKKLIISGRDYLIDSVVAPVMSGDLEVECEIGARFIASSGLGSRMFFFNRTSGADISLKWTGGRTDMSALGLGGAGTSWDHFYVGEKFDDVSFQFIDIYSGEDYTTNHADSGIFCVAKKFVCQNSRFQGLWDSGIYLSGDISESNGESASIENNKFIKCNVGVISKRRWRRYVVSGNFFDRPVTAIATGEADTTLLPGDNNIITDNEIVQPKACGIQVAIGTGSIVANNRIEDQGYDLADVIVAAGSSGIALKGSKDCVVEGNWIGMRRFTTGTSAHRAIQMERRTFNAVNYDATGNLVAHNRIDGINTGIREEDANQDRNRVMHNVITNATSKTIRNGANSFWTEFDSDTSGRISYIGTVSLGGNFGAESLRVNPVAGAVDFVSISGSTSGTPIVQASGASTNIDLRLLPKGTGVTRFGAFTANADAPITGYVTIKTDDGTTRKLAVIA